MSQRLVSKGSNFSPEFAISILIFHPLRKDRITPFFVPLDLNESGITKLIFFPSLSKSFRSRLNTPISQIVKAIE